MPSTTTHPAATREDTSLDKSRAQSAPVTGDPPRIPPLEPHEISKDVSEIINRLRRAVSLPPAKEIPAFNATMMRHPALYEPHALLALALFRGALTPRDRELAVLRAGWLCRSALVWGQHVKIGKQVGGLTDEEVARVTIGSTATGWSEPDRALLKAVEELHTDSMISDATWAILSRSLDERQLIELPILVGQYQGVAYLHNSLRMEIAADNEGLSER